MDAHGVDILHVADGDHVARAVPDDLILDFLPAGDAALNEHLSHTAQTNAVGGNLVEVLHGIGNAAAGAAQGIGRPNDHGQADLLGKSHCIVHTLHHLGGDTGLSNGLHGILKALTILSLPDGLGAGAQQTHTVLFQSAVLCQCHGQIQAGLAAQRRKDRVRPLHLDDLGHGGSVQRLNIYMIGNVLIRHDGGGVGVDQHHLNALFPEAPTCLSTGIVKLSSLSDDNRAGAQNHYLLNAFILRHVSSPPSSQ